jgi:hypothetical protein
MVEKSRVEKNRVEKSTNQNNRAQTNRVEKKRVEKNRIECIHMGKTQTTLLLSQCITIQRVVIELNTKRIEQRRVA